MAASLEKYQRMQTLLHDFGSVLIAYSGGLDSAFVLYAAVSTMGADKLLAVTADSASYPRSELEQARAFASALGLAGNHLVIPTDELEDPNYTANPMDRCFFCKQELFGKLTRLAEERGIRTIIDGYNADDVGDFRPGRRAAALYQVRSPLFEADLHKSEIRELAREFGLKVWDKPQSACLSSRIPYGSPVTKEKLKQIEDAEAFLRSLGFGQARVRHHDQLARIELTQPDLDRIWADDLKAKIITRFKELGFVWVTLDLAGFRSGSMNEALDSPRQAGLDGEQQYG